MKTNYWVQRALIAGVWLLAPVAGYCFSNHCCYETAAATAKINATGPIANGNPLRFPTKYCDTKAEYCGYRYYSATAGRWLSRDPLAEQAGATLYAIGHNDPVNTVDILGLDFIALADRAVKGLGGTVFHYSIQYWLSCGAEAPETESGVDWWRETHPGSKKVRSVELLRDTGWSVWAKKPGEGFWTLLETSVSVIHFSDSAENFIAVFSGQAASVRDVWRVIQRLAKDYAYAEQEGFKGAFRHWPNSKYGTPTDTPFNNSNTFVRDTIKQAGLGMKEMYGSHPGNDSPVPVPDIYSGQLPFQGPGTGHSPDN